MQFQQAYSSSEKKSLRSSGSLQSPQDQPNPNEANISSLKFLSPPSASEESYSQYVQFFADVEYRHRSHAQLIHELQVHGISYNHNYIRKFYKANSDYHFKIVSVKPTKNYQIVSMQVNLGPFSQTLLLYNTFQTALLPKPSTSNIARRAQIIKLNLNEQKIVAKSMFLLISQSKSDYCYENFVNAVKQYFITKIMSILKIGPKICQQLSFDLFVSIDQISFFIEECEEIQKSIGQKDIETLKIGLKEMHVLQILHTDIKPDNIMYSPSYEKIVFIDFGISDYRSEKSDELSYTGFAGTYAYCTDELKRLFEMRQNQWVNLYLNDVFGLKLSIKQATKRLTWCELGYVKKRQDVAVFKSPYFLQEIEIKYVFYTGKNQKILEFLTHLIPHFYHQIMNFLYEVLLNQNIRRIYQEYVEQYAKKFKGYEDLKQILSNRIYFQSYKGRRKFQNSQITQKKDLYENFYEVVENENFQKVSQRTLKVNELEFILFDKDIDLLDFNRYEQYVIEFLSFSRVQNVVPLDKKLEVCENYLRLKQVVPEQEIRSLSVHQTFYIVLEHILTSMPVSKKIQIFLVFRQALNIFMLLSNSVQINTLRFIEEVILEVAECTDMSCLSKTEIMLTTIIFMDCVGQPSQKKQAQLKRNQIKKVIKTSILLYSEEKRLPKQQILHQIYFAYFKSAYLQLSVENQQSASQTLQKIDFIRKQIKTPKRITTNLLNFIQDKLLTKVEKANKRNFHKRQKEQMLDEEMQKHKQLNINLPHIISYYTGMKNIKKLKKYISIFDSCVQIQSVSYRYYFFERLLVLFMDETEPEAERSKKISYLCSKYMPKFVPSKQYIFSFAFNVQSFFYFYTNLQKQKVAIPEELHQIMQTIIENVPLAIKIYEEEKLYLSDRKNKNSVYFNLLKRCLDTQCRTVLRQTGREFNSLEMKCELYPKINTFHKIINLNRDEFNGEDHIFMIIYDLVWIKHSNSENSCRKMLNYVFQRKDMIAKDFRLQNHKQKVQIIYSFQFMLAFIADDNDLELMKESSDFVREITDQKMILDNYSSNLFEQIVKLLIKLGKFDQILKIVQDSSKTYLEELNIGSVILLAKFYSYIVAQFFRQSKQQSLDTSLHRLLPQLDLKTIPVFGIFLLNCINLSNRKNILKHLILCLENIKYQGKIFILSRFYKQVLKLHQFAQINKKRFVMKKDVKYPSKHTKNLDDIKMELNYQGKILYFGGCFKVKLDEKIIKFGECCQIYSSKKKFLQDDNFINLL